MCTAPAVPAPASVGALARAFSFAFQPPAPFEVTVYDGAHLPDNLAVTLSKPINQ